MFPKTAVLVLIVLGGLIQSVFAQEGAMLTVDTMEFCTGVEEREPVGADSIFAATVEKVFCFTAISGATDTTTVSHVWYHQDEEKARVDLQIKGANWRTWSSKNIAADWTGVWRVDVTSASGEVLESKQFQVEAAGDE